MAWHSRRPSPGETSLAHGFRQHTSTSAVDWFDRLVLSHEVGHMKPDQRFYQACVAAAGVPASSCLFIDDLPENVEGARRAGLTGLRYVETPALIDDLSRLGVEVPTGEG